VNSEGERLEKWKQGQLDRLQMLMRQLVEEQEQMEEEFAEKLSEADDIKSCLELEQGHLESDLRIKDQEVRSVEGHLQNVEEDLKRLDDGAGTTWHGSWKTKDLLLDEGSVMSKGGFTDDGLSVSSYGGNKLEDHSASSASNQRGGENTKAALRSEARPVPLPITASRSSKSLDPQAPPVQSLFEDQAANKARGGEPNGVAEKQRQATPQRHPSPQPATASNVSPTVQKAGIVSNAAPARNLVRDVSPLHSGQQHQQASQAVYRVPSAGPTAARMAPAGVSGYPAVARQAPPTDVRLQPQPYPQVPMPDGLGAPMMSRDRQMPMRNANVAGYAPNSSAPAAQSSLFNWDM